MAIKLNLFKEKPVATTVAGILVIALVVTLSVPFFYQIATQSKGDYFDQQHIARTTYISTQVLYWEVNSRAMGAASPFDLFFPDLSDTGTTTAPEPSAPSEPEPPAFDSSSQEPTAGSEAAKPPAAGEQSIPEGTQSADPAADDGTDAAPPADDANEAEATPDADAPAPDNTDEPGSDTGEEPYHEDSPPSTDVPAGVLDGDTLEVAQSALNDITNGWRNTYHNTWGALPYAVFDANDQFLVGDSSLAQILEGSKNAYESQYGYWIALRFDSNGNLNIPVLEGASATHLGNANSAHDAFYSYWEDELLRYLDPDVVGVLSQHFRPAHDMTFVFTAPHQVGWYNELISGRNSYNFWSFRAAGFDSLYYVSIALAALLAFVTGPRVLDLFPVIRRALYLEVCLSVVFIAFAYMHIFIDIAFTSMNRAAVNNLTAMAGLGFFFLLFVLMLALVYLSALFLADIRKQGLRAYIYERLLVLVILRRFYHWVGDIDLADPGNVAIVKILAINYVVLVVFSGFSPFGIVCFAAYSIVLFFTIRRFLREMSASYRAVLRAADEMAEGRLDTVIEEDLGMFDQLGAALGKVQQGFRHAVDAETRSQKMRTELITNVSHDLKTPLTGIITYVNLLKEDNLSDEDRKSYVATLDLKSQRLRVLIEDLFEISRVNSGNVVIHKSPLDLPALIRQVMTECEPEVEAADVELRHRFPEEHVMIDLDGEKTSRIFQNLIINVTKYAMPGTRAYIDLHDAGDHVCVEIKNVSREALDFDPEYITERFVRGDSSRGTAGSGLGLAIARSFAELQDGSLGIAFDGDLFKAVVTFMRSPDEAEAQ